MIASKTTYCSTPFNKREITDLPCIQSNFRRIYSVFEARGTTLYTADGARIYPVYTFSLGRLWNYPVFSTLSWNYPGYTLQYRVDPPDSCLIQGILMALVNAGAHLPCIHKLVQLDTETTLYSIETRFNNGFNKARGARGHH